MRSKRNRSFEHLLAIVGFVHFVAAALQNGTQEFAAAQRIVGDENPRSRRSLVTLRANWES